MHVGVILFTSFASISLSLPLFSHRPKTSPLPCNLPPLHLLQCFPLYPLYSAMKDPSLSELRAELDDLITELQTVEGDAAESDGTDGDSSSTEVSSLSSYESSEKEYRSAPLKQIDELKKKNERLVQSLGVILKAHSPQSRPSLNDSVETNQNSVILSSEFIDVASNVVAAAQSMQQLSETLKKVNLDA